MKRGGALVRGRGVYGGMKAAVMKGLNKDFVILVRGFPMCEEEGVDAARERTTKGKEEGE